MAYSASELIFGSRVREVSGLRHYHWRNRECSGCARQLLIINIHGQTLVKVVKHSATLCRSQPLGFIRVTSLQEGVIGWGIHWQPNQGNYLGRCKVHLFLGVETVRDCHCPRAQLFLGEGCSRPWVWLRLCFCRVAVVHAWQFLSLPVLNRLSCYWLHFSVTPLTWPKLSSTSATQISQCSVLYKLDSVS